MLRRLSDRARLEGMLALRKAIDTVRGQVARPAGPPPDDAPPPGVLRITPDRRRPDDSAWLRRAESDRVRQLRERERAQVRALAFERLDHPSGDRLPAAGASHGDPALAAALDRMAASIDRVATQLEAYHRERTEHLDALELVLREMLITSAAPPAARPIVLGGVVDPDAIEGPGPAEISLVDVPVLDVSAPVEVRSRFHDRWIPGFSIAEVVDTPGRLRYRLTRRSDGIPLPILFDAADVRAASRAFEREPSPS